MSTYNRKKWVTIPNILSCIRLLLVPLFVLTYLKSTEPIHYYYAALILLISGLTDLLDGWIARKYQQISEVGKLLDPLADKITQAAIIFCLLTRYEWMWSIILLFVAKELFMGVCNLVLLRRGTKLDGAKWYGKLSTAVFYICMFFLIAFPTIATSQAILLISITAFFLSLSFILYGKIFIQMYQATKK